MRKPIDIGDGASCASFLPGGEWLAVTTPAPVHGMVELTGAPEFDEAWRGDPRSVRRYRESLTRRATAFLVPFANVELTVVASGVDDDGVLWMRCESDRDLRPHESLAVRVEFNGRLQRPPYAEITEIAPLAPLLNDSRVKTHDDRLSVRSEVLGASAVIDVALSGNQPLSWAFDVSGLAYCEGLVSADPEEPRPVITLRCRLVTTPDERPRHTPRSPLAGGWALHRIGPVIEPALTRRLAQIVEGSRAYILDCCTLAVSEDESVIITDHRLLPLSWTRDAYYMALLLLLCGDRDAISAVGRHLRWLWGRAHSAGPWMRSHLASGEVKDPGLQADQQLYPILELIDFRRAAGSWPALPAEAGRAAWGELIAEAIDDLPVHDRTGLLMSDENPADDASGLPLLFSTQVLFAHVLDGLAEWADELSLNRADFAARASIVRTSTRAVFADGDMFAYEADGLGRTRLYGDANDLPTALAPAWGFCSADDEMWRRTMGFILSPENPGWSAGSYGGLGSAHTQGTWPLGDVQSLILARALRRDDDELTQLSRLAEIAADDGLLPEAYDSATGEWTARHWFGWPAAAAAAALLSPSMTVPVEALNPDPGGD